MGGFRFYFLSLLPAILCAAPFSCATDVPAPTYVRPEGFTELLGEVRLTCNGDPPAGGIVADVELATNTPITTARAGSESEALLLIGDAQFGWRIGVNALRGIYSSVNSLKWSAVRLVEGGSHRAGASTFRIVNLRIDATTLGGPSGPMPRVIFAVVKVSGVEVRGPQRMIAVITSPLLTEIRHCDGTPAAPASYSAHQPVNTALLGERSGAASLNYIVRFTEGFEGAFKPKNPVMGGGPEPPSEDANIPGLTPPSSAPTGTRLQLRFQPVPAGASIFVTADPTLPGRGTSDSISAKFIGFEGGRSINDPFEALNRPDHVVDLDAVQPCTAKSLAAGSKDSEDGPCYAVARCGMESLNVIRLPKPHDVSLAVWEITSADPAAIEEISFGVALAYRSDPANWLPNPGVIAVSAGFAPIVSLINMPPSPPVPRFAETYARNLLSIVPPTIKLVFPVVSNQAGYDTELSVTNTSGGWAAGCGLEFAGQQPGSNAPPPYKWDSTPAGVPRKFRLSSVAPGFQGCVLATCTFPAARGDFRIFPMTGGADFLSGPALDPIAPSVQALGAADAASLGLAKRCAFLKSSDAAKPAK
jgi:hypothetical protein